MPTTDSNAEIYQECLLDIEKLINTHSHDPIVMAGNFNAHVGPPGGPRGSRPTENLHGKLQMELVDRNDLHFTSLSNCSGGPCYTFFRGEAVSAVDYIITDAVSAPLVHSCSTLDPTQSKHRNDSLTAHLN